MEEISMKFRMTRIAKSSLSIAVILILLVFSINSHADDEPSSETVMPDLATGTFKYSIPIKVPFGRKGMMPDLTLQYRSTNGNGPFGMGWELEVGSIQKKQNYYDQYALLRTGSAIDLVDIDHVEYRPLIEGEFNRIKKLTAPDGQPYWEVTNKAGVVFRFGYTSASRQDDPANVGNIFKWCLDLVQDPNGNFETFSYFKDHGQIYLNVIQYTGNGGTQPNSYVSFGISTMDSPRQDAQYMYSAGFAVKTNYLVKAIFVGANSKPVRAYQLLYGISSVSGRETLTGIQEYGSDVTSDSSLNLHGTSLPPITFGYQSTDFVSQFTGAGWGLTTWPSFGGASLPLSSKCLSGDFDGDGKTDLACWLGSNSWVVAWPNPSASNWSAQSYTATQGLSLTSPISSQCIAGNTYGIGKTSIACYSGSGSNWNMIYDSLNTGKSFGQVSPFTGPVTTIPFGNNCISGGFTGNLEWVTDIACYNGSNAWPGVLLSTDGSGPILVSTGIVSGPIPPSNDCFVGNFVGQGSDSIACASGNQNTWTLNGTWTWSTGQKLWSNYPATAQCITGDFNGDGISDLACYNSTNMWWLIFSTGNGWADTAIVINGPSLAYPVSQLPVAAQCVTGDFNGDGITDIACTQGGYNWGLALSGHWQNQWFSWQGPPVPLPVTQTPIRDQCVVGDLNGDGKTDLACLQADGSWRVSIANFFPTDLLSSISNGTGAVIGINYTPSTAYQNTQLPFPVQTVSSIGVCDNYSSTTPGCVGNYSLTSYSYSGGYYYIATNDFRGFNYAKVIGPSGSSGEQTVIETWFHQGNDLTVDANTPNFSAGYMKGKPYRVRVSDGQGNKISETTTTYSPNLSSLLTYYGGHIYFNPPQEVDVAIYDGGTTPTKQTKTVYSYDAYGNVTEQDQYGDISDSTDDRTIVTTYNNYNTDKWIVGLPASENIYQGIGTTTQVAGKTYYYDDLTACNGTPTNNQTPILGNLTRVVSWNNNTVSNGGANTEIRMAYYNNGNLECTRDANQNTPTTITYDGTDTFPRIVTNPLGQTTTVYYGVDGMAVNGPGVTTNGQYGQVASITDPNQLATTMQYDELGRLTKKTEPDQFWTSWAYPNASSPDNQPGVVGSQHIQTTTSLGTGFWSAVYFDGLGRTVMEKKSGPNNQTITKQTTYDGRGAIATSSFPYFEGAGTPPYTYTHDAQGRITQTTKPDATTTKSCYSYPVKVTIDENGHRKRQTTDVYGRLVKVEEYRDVYPGCTTDEGSPYATTTYAYDVLGNLRFVKDNKNQTTVNYQTEMRYDSLGHKYYMSDPDMGVWNYLYDANGNLTSQTDAKGQKIAYGYDALNRPTWKDYNADGTHEITYTYDELTSAYPKGHLTTMTDLSGTTRYYYDAYRTFRTKKTVNGADYTTVATYDGLNRIAALTYPDNETVSYVYDPTGGNLSQVAGYVSYAGYNALGQPGSVTFGDGITTSATTNYTYYPLNNRLNRLNTIITTVPGLTTPIVSLAYDYYGNGNIKTVTDNVNNAVPQNVTNRNYSLYPGKAHAFGVTGANFQYDANGNLTADGQRTVTYNYDNMPDTITAASGNTIFKYDGTGQRVQKQAPVGTTTYIDKFYECIGGTCAKYIFAGDTRIALKSAGKTLYYHADLQGSTVAVTDANGHNTDAVSYLPYGETTEQPVPPNLGVNHKYTGQELDYETGLYNYGARLYDPTAGRFVTPDSIVPDFANPQSLNRYAYALNNPMRYIDPTGHYPDDTDSTPPLDLTDELGSVTTDTIFIPGGGGNTSGNSGTVISNGGGGTSGNTIGTGSSSASGNGGSESLFGSSNPYSISTLNNTFSNPQLSAGSQNMPIVVAEGIEDRYRSFEGGGCMAGCGGGGGAGAATEAVEAAEEGVIGARGSEIQPYFPSNNGFLGETSPRTLYPGETIDRYGGGSASRFFSPTGTPQAARSLPPGTNVQPLRVFEVVKPFEVEAGTVAPAYGQPGLGTQYRAPTSLEILLNHGIIREVGR
ncbi:MAG TPA: SpvB/TcaC N-terminal domain-containing protein [Geobacteraceae bacterium]